MYSNVPPGGYVLVDNYHTAACGDAINTFRRLTEITDTIEHVGRADIYWRRSLKAAQSHQYDKDSIRRAMIIEVSLKSTDQ